MKKLLSLFAVAAVFAIACEEKPAPEPEAKSFAVSPISDISMSAEGGTATITIESDINWTVECNNSTFSVNPTSGNGNGTVQVNVPANTTTEQVKAAVSVIPEKLSGLQNAGIKTVTINIVQEAAEPEPGPTPDPPTPDPDPSEVKNPQPEGVLAEWVFCTDNLSFFNEHFSYDDAKAKDADGSFIAGKPGYISDDHYCPSTSGKGRIRMLNVVDKSGTDINPKGVVKRGMGNYGEPCFYGPLKGDQVNIYAYPAEPYDGIAAGTKVHIFFALRPNTKNTPKYWILEVKDGADWAPIGEVKKTTVADDGEIEYNIEMIFNPDGQGMQADAEGNKTIFPENPQQINTFIDQTYTFKSSVNMVEYRLTCAANIGADGVTSCVPLGTGGTAVLRIAGKDSNSGGAHPVENPTVIEIIK